MAVIEALRSTTGRPISRLKQFLLSRWKLPIPWDVIYFIPFAIWLDKKILTIFAACAKLNRFIVWRKDFSIRRFLASFNVFFMLISKNCKHSLIGTILERITMFLNFDGDVLLLYVNLKYVIDYINSKAQQFEFKCFFKLHISRTFNKSI